MIEVAASGIYFVIEKDVLFKNEEEIRALMEDKITSHTKNIPINSLIHDITMRLKNEYKDSDYQYKLTISLSREKFEVIE